MRAPGMDGGETDGNPTAAGGVSWILGHAAACIRSGQADRVLAEVMWPDAGHQGSLSPRFRIPTRVPHAPHPGSAFVSGRAALRRPAFPGGVARRNVA